MVDRRDDNLSLAVIGNASPIHSACISRRFDGGFRVWWSEKALRFQGTNQVATPAAVVEGEPPCIFFGDCCVRCQRRSRRERLRRGARLTLDSGLWNRSFDDLVYRFSGFTIEDENRAHLRRLHDGGN